MALFRRKPKGTEDPKRVFGEYLAKELVPTQEKLTAIWETIDSLQGIEDKRNRVKAEAFLLAAYAGQYAIRLAFMNNPDGAIPILEAFYSYLQDTRSDIEDRCRVYDGATNSPHPEYGISYSVGRAFAVLCGVQDDIALITIGAKQFQTLAAANKKFAEAVRAEIDKQTV